MTPDQLKFLLSLRPEQIYQWFRSKGLVTSWRWDEVWQQAHQKSFTVAKVMKLDILQDLKNEVEKIFDSGITFEQFRKNLEPILKKNGWWGKVKASDVPGYDPSSGIDPNKIVQLGSPHRLKTIYRVNASVGYNSACFKSQWANRGSRPYWWYIQLDRPTKRISHEPFDDKVFMCDDPIWNIIYPPSGWFCMCSVRALTKDEVEQHGLKIYNGDEFSAAISKIPPEWAYNPGKENFKPDLSKYDKDIASQYK